MTVEAYITQKFQSFGYTLSEADLLDACINLDKDAEVTALNMSGVLLGIHKIIPQVLAHPTSISEGGMTIKWDKNGLLAYYNMLSRTLDVADEYGKEPSVKFINLRKR